MLDRKAFAEHVGSTFTVVKTGIPGSLDVPFGPVELDLTRVEDLTRENVDAFSLLFRGPRDKEFGQATYRLDHKRLGRVDLFLVPILDPQSHVDSRVCYQAIVSRLR